MRSTAAILVLVALALTGAAPATACGFHGGPVGTLDLAYPGSLSVAVAVASAKDDGLLPARDPTRSPFGFHMAKLRLEAFAAALRADKAEPLDSRFSLVLVGPRLWTAVDFDSGSATAMVHAPGPSLGWPVVMTDFLVVDAILSGRIGIGNALERGMIRIDGDAEETVKALLVASFSPVAKRP